MPDEQWKTLAGAAGFACEPALDNADRLGRDGIRWRTFVARREHLARARCVVPDRAVL